MNRFMLAAPQQQARAGKTARRGGVSDGTAPARLAQATSHADALPQTLGATAKLPALRTGAGGIHEPGSVDVDAHGGAVAAGRAGRARWEHRQGRHAVSPWPSATASSALHFPQHQLRYHLPACSHLLTAPRHCPLTRRRSGRTRACMPQTGHPGGPCWSAPRHYRPGCPTWGTPTGRAGSR